MMRFSCIAAVALTISATAANAQAVYPERNIRLLFGFPPGSDVNIRLIADKLSDALGKSIIIEYVTGAAGGIAADRTAKASPDGYTVGALAGANIVINKILYTKLPYDPVKDLVPVSLIIEHPNILVVNNDVPAKSVDDLIAFARANPGKIAFGHSGIGSTQHLAGELFRIRAKIDIQQIPYRGPPQIVTDLLGSTVSLSFLSPLAALPLIDGGEVRALAVTSRTRVPFAPQLPTMIELGFEDFELTSWSGFFVPARTPPATIGRLNKEIVRVMALPQVRSQVMQTGNVPLSSTPAEFAARIASDIPHWAKIIKEVGVQAID